MSIQWGIGDLLAVTKLAWDLYHNCFLVAKEAPDDFRQLVNELASLQNVLRTLRDDVNSDEKFLDRLGEHRQEMLERCVSSCFDTLKKLRDLVEKYKKLGVRDGGLQFWRKLKWVTQQGEIAELKSKIMVHACNINLCMSSIGNSSLARIESSMMKALERQEEAQEAADTVGETSLLSRARTAPIDHQDVELDSGQGLRRQYTGSTLVDRALNISPETTPSMSGDDDTVEFGNGVTSSPAGRVSISKESPSARKPRRSSTLSANQESRIYPPSPLPSEDGFPTTAKKVHPEKQPSKNQEFAIKNRTKDVEDVVAEALRELSKIRQKEQSSRPLRIVPQHPIHHPDPDLMTCFEELSRDELEFRRLNVRDWLRVATWWTCKAKHNKRSFETPSSPTIRESFSRSSEAKSPMNQAYVDLLKASWILYDIILKGDNLTPLLTNENRKLFYNLSDGIRDEIDDFHQVDIPEKETLNSQNLNIWEQLQPEEELQDEEDLLPGLENARWITVDQKDAGEEDEEVLFRTFVDAAIGGKKHRVWSKGAPYMLMLSIKEGESEPKVTMCNQSGTLGVTRDFTVGDLQDPTPASSPSLGMDQVNGIEPIQLNFGKLDVEVAFRNENDFDIFMRIPRNYFEAVKRREPRQMERATEKLLFKSSLDVCEQLKATTMQSLSPRQCWQSCDLRVLETTGKEGWKTTRRLAVSSSAGERKPWCREFFLPLSRVQLSRDGINRSVIVKWSDCLHESSDKTDGNYNPVFSYVYNDSNPNNALSLLFRNQADATEFERTVLQLSLTPTFSWSTGSDPGFVYDVFDTEPTLKNYKAFLITHTRNDCRYSDLFYMYRDTDYQYESSALRVRLPQIYYTDYISTHVEKLFQAPRDDPPRFSHCEKRLNHTTIDFEDESTSQAFMSSLTGGHELVFSRRAHSISTKAPSRFKSSKSNKGSAEVQLWRKGKVQRLVSRWDEKVDDKWTTLVVPRGGTTHSKDSNRVSLPKVQYDRGRLIDMANLVARSPKEKTEVKKSGPITIAFQSFRDLEDFNTALEGRDPQNLKKHSGVLQDLLDFD